MLFTGGSIRGGTVLRTSGKIAAYPDRHPVNPDDIAATIIYALGLNPETEVFDTLNRPLPISAGKPIGDLFG